MHQDLYNIIKENIIRCRPGDWEHSQRVVGWVEKFGNGREDFELLKVAAYIHDIGWRDVVPQGQKLTKDQLKKLEPQANRNSVPYATEILKQLGHTDSDIDIILKLIQAADSHSSNSDQESIIVDADNLSKLSIDHLKEKYVREDWIKMITLWEEEFPKRIKTDEGKRIYPKLLAELKHNCI